MMSKSLVVLYLFVRLVTLTAIGIAIILIEELAQIFLINSLPQ
jgi:hypothetical protein